MVVRTRYACDAREVARGAPPASLRHLVRNAVMLRIAAVLQHGEIRALDRAVDAVGALRSRVDKRTWSPKPFSSPISMI